MCKGIVKKPPPENKNIAESWALRCRLRAWIHPVRHQSIKSPFHSFGLQECCSTRLVLSYLAKPPHVEDRHICLYFQFRLLYISPVDIVDIVFTRLSWLMDDLFPYVHRGFKFLTYLVSSNIWTIWKSVRIRTRAFKQADHYANPRIITDATACSPTRHLVAGHFGRSSTRICACGKSLKFNQKGQSSNCWGLKCLYKSECSDKINRDHSAISIGQDPGHRLWKDALYFGPEYGRGKRW